MKRLEQKTHTTTYIQTCICKIDQIPCWKNRYGALIRRNQIIKEKAVRTIANIERLASYLLINSLFLLK